MNNLKRYGTYQDEYGNLMFSELMDGKYYLAEEADKVIGELKKISSIKDQTIQIWNQNYEEQATRIARLEEGIRKSSHFIKSTKIYGLHEAPSLVAELEEILPDPPAPEKSNAIRYAGQCRHGVPLANHCDECGKYLASKLQPPSEETSRKEEEFLYGDMFAKVIEEDGKKLFICSCQSDQGDSQKLEIIKLVATTFPMGTRVTIKEPAAPIVEPENKEVPEYEDRTLWVKPKPSPEWRNMLAGEQAISGRDERSPSCMPNTWSKVEVDYIVQFQDEGRFRTPAARPNPVAGGEKNPFCTIEEVIEPPIVEAAIRVRGHMEAEPSLRTQEGLEEILREEFATLIHASLLRKVAVPEITEERIFSIVDELNFGSTKGNRPLMSGVLTKRLKEVFHPQPQVLDPCYRSLVQRLADWSRNPHAGWLVTGIGVAELHELEAEAKRLCPQPQAKGDLK